MGAIEDVRKVIQDLVAPELKSLQEQIKRVDDGSKFRDDASKMRDEALLAKIDSNEEASKLRDETLSARLDAKLEHLLAEMKANQAFLIYSLNIDKRVEAIERKTADPIHAT